MTVLILGLGNLLLGDEGVGIHVIRHIEEHLPLPPEVRVVDGGTLGFTLIPLLDSATGLVIIDAANLSAPAGSIRIFHDAAMDAQWRTIARNAHQIGIADWLTMAPLRGRTLPPRCLVAIQPENLDWGAELSAACRAAVATAAAQAAEWAVNGLVGLRRA